MNESIGQTPARILFDREMKLSSDLVFGCKLGEDLEFILDRGTNFECNFTSQRDANDHRYKHKRMIDGSDRM